MTKQLKWRLGKLPTPDEVLKLVNDKLITKEEARDILFNEENTDQRDENSLKEEIKFLREIVDKLSKNRDRTVEIIRQVQVPYYNYGWIQPYVGWCSSDTLTTTPTSLLVGSDNNMATYSVGTVTGATTTISGTSNFSEIQTF